MWLGLAGHPQCVCHGFRLWATGNRGLGCISIGPDWSHGMLLGLLRVPSALLMGSLSESRNYLSEDR